MMMIFIAWIRICKSFCVDSCVGWRRVINVGSNLRAEATAHIEPPTLWNAFALLDAFDVPALRDWGPVEVAAFIEGLEIPFS